MELTKKTIESLGITYIEAGEGEPLVVLHGWGANIQSVMAIVNTLKDRFHVYAYDAPGFGDSAEPQTVWGTEDYARCLEAVLKALDIERADFIGHSFGGKTLSVFAAKHPEQVNRLCLVDASGVLPKRTLSYYLQVYSFKALRKLYTTIVPGDKTEKLQKFYARFGSDDYQASQGLMRRTFVKVVNESTAHYFARIKAPTLLIWGDKDDATPLYMARVFEASIPDSGLVVLDGGHFSYVDDYGTFQAAIRSFFN
ncbi:alpha/beta hydrolase [Peptoniphilus equinus]|uniref:Alpha/beta hydrolase n=1 Tax=Peptoniphilus equinus TaxID=3016343 RepID=A0ABY7QS35_9FIRM|nr:alpha/beta hydrolase [Peptoniphilus equinus]WBW49611.1 alpha/beta hydrolase [Peptoniphilus equinus]